MNVERSVATAAEKGYSVHKKQEFTHKMLTIVSVTRFCIILRRQKITTP